MFFLSGCTTAMENPPAFQYQELQTSYFKLASWQKIGNPQQPYKIYIEGDGYAFRASGTVSSDPTPRGRLLREIAFGDKHENVVYLARPCQYVKDKACSPQYWSNARFADEVIRSEYEAVKQIVGDAPLTLVGFSGGAQVAGLMAVKYDDLNIRKLVTVAGNLDVQTWVEYHRLTPLDLSDDLRHYRRQYTKFNQIHYIGTQDNIVIPSISENFIVDPQTIRKINGASHNTGWKDTYEAIRQE